MLQNTQPQIEIRESGKLTQAYKRKVMIKHVKQAMSITAHVAGAVLIDMAQYSAHQFSQLSRPVRLDIVDYMYGTNLRSQYFSGIRTQKILKAKRDFGLM